MQDWTPPHHISTAWLVKLLQRVPLFAGLFPDEYQALAEACHIRPLRAGRVLFQQGDPGYHMYVVLSGRIDILRADGGVLHSMHPGELFGEMAVVNKIRRTATAVAPEDSNVLEVSRDALDSLLGRAPRVSYLIMSNIARTLVERLIDANERQGRFELPNRAPAAGGDGAGQRSTRRFE